MNKKIFLSLFIFALSFSFVLAEVSEKNSAVLQSFKQIVTISKIEIIVPTVVEIIMPNQIYGTHFGVYNQTKDKFEPYDAGSGSTLLTFNPTKIQINSSDISDKSLSDGNFQTYTQFDVNEEGRGKVEIEYSFTEEVRSSSVYVSLEQYVSLPNLITIKVIENGKEKIIASKIRPDSSRINFPITSSKEWKFEIEYSQPLRINELQINNLNTQETPTVLRFLAQPNTEYKIYAEPDSIMNQQTGERPDLSSSRDVKNIQFTKIDKNPSYKLVDTDQDTIPDIYDNCVMISNINQEDINQNNRGDVCDDFDKDGIINSQDNCINEPNRDQKDTDNDLIGDVCDGVESRLTEKYPWLVWGGIIFAGLLFLALFAIAIKKIRLTPTDSQAVKEDKISDSIHKDSM